MLLYSQSNRLDGSKMIYVIPVQIKKKIYIVRLRKTRLRSAYVPIFYYLIKGTWRRKRVIIFQNKNILQMPIARTNRKPVYILS